MALPGETERDWVPLGEKVVVGTAVDERDVLAVGVGEGVWLTPKDGEGVQVRVGTTLRCDVGVWVPESETVRDSVLSCVCDGDWVGEAVGGLGVRVADGGLPVPVQEKVWVAAGVWLMVLLVRVKERVTLRVADGGDTERVEVGAAVPVGLSECEALQVRVGRVGVRDPVPVRLWVIVGALLMVQEVVSDADRDAVVEPLRLRLREREAVACAEPVLEPELERVKVVVRPGVGVREALGGDSVLVEAVPVGDGAVGEALGDAVEVDDGDNDPVGVGDGVPVALHVREPVRDRVRVNDTLQVTVSAAERVALCVAEVLPLGLTEGVTASEPVAVGLPGDCVSTRERDAVADAVALRVARWLSDDVAVGGVPVGRAVCVVVGLRDRDRDQLEDSDRVALALAVGEAVAVESDCEGLRVSEAVGDAGECEAVQVDVQEGLMVDEQVYVWVG